MFLVFNLILDNDNKFLAHELFYTLDAVSEPIFLVTNNGYDSQYKRINVFRKYFNVIKDDASLANVRQIASEFLVGRDFVIAKREDCSDNLKPPVKTNLVGEIMSTKDLIGSKDKQIADLKLILATKETEIYRLTKSLRQAEKKKGPWDK